MANFTWRNPCIKKGLKIQRLRYSICASINATIAVGQIQTPRKISSLSKGVWLGCWWFSTL